MRTFKFLTVTLVVFLFFNFNSSAQSTDPDMVIVRTYETSSLNGLIKPPSMVISYGANKTEVIELDLLVTRNKGIITNTEKIYAALAKLIKEGYTITSSTGSGSENVLLTTYILIKPKQ